MGRLCFGPVTRRAPWRSPVAPDQPLPYSLRGIELATSLVYGSDDEVAPLPVEPSPPPRVVLEAVVVEALQRAPCVVSFSGGRDSSALLALTAYLARREGLDPPIAVTNVFPGDVQAAETEWQELLIGHIGLGEWERFVLSDEMDVLGPYATPLLERFGPTFPFNGHFGVPSFALAAGGTYLTGVGGDELFEPNEATRLALVLSGELGPRRLDLRGALETFGPRARRVRHWQRRIPAEPWLRPEVSDAFTMDLAGVLADQSFWYDDQIRHDVWRDRARIALQRTLTAFGATADVVVSHPFQDRAFLSAIAAYRGRVPWRGRAAAMSDLFGDVLPGQVVRRTTKASFDAIFFNEHSRAFVRDWDGAGLDTNLIDIARLRAGWEKSAVDARSLSLLQAAWCHSRVALL